MPDDVEAVMLSSEGPPLTEGVRIADPAIERSRAPEERLRRIRVIQVTTLALCGTGVVSVYEHSVLGIPEICLALLLATAAGIVGFVTGQRRGERALGETDAELRREAAYVRILEYAAVAANEATTLDDAMREGVKRICLAMGWPVGHIYTVEADGTLQTTGVFFDEDDEHFASLRENTPGTPLPTGEGLPERALASGRPEALYDLPADSEQFPAGLARQLGLKTAFAIPVMTHERVAGVIEFGLRERMAPNPRVFEILAFVGVQIGRVAARTEVHQRFRQAQKMEAIGRLSAGLAHEINNPMAYVRSNLNYLLSEWKGLRSELETLDGAAPLMSRLEDCGELIEETIEGVERTVSIVREIRKSSHAGDDSREPTDLRDIVDSALRMASSHAPSGVTVRRHDGDDLPPVLCVANQLNQVLVNGQSRRERDRGRGPDRVGRRVDIPRGRSGGHPGRGQRPGNDRRNAGAALRPVLHHEGGG
jgi:K+-sensing histidine kinase KdpD